MVIIKMWIVIAMGIICSMLTITAINNNNNWDYSLKATIFNTVTTTTTIIDSNRDQRARRNHPHLQRW